jgi:acyl-CoA dehydrogenase
MPINVTPIPGLSPEINDIRRRTADLINTEVLPYEEILWRSRRGEHDGSDVDTERRASHDRREEVKAKVQAEGLWAPHLPREYGGAGLDFLSLAYMYEILAYAVGAGSLFGIAAPN